jgi:glucokinase
MIDTASRPTPARARPEPVAEADPQVRTIGIDVGGTKTACVVTNARDDILFHEVVPTDAARLPGQLGEVVQRVVDHLGAAAGSPISAVGVALPGQVDPRTGQVRLAVNLGGSDMALGPLLSHATGLPVYVEHDARAAAAWLHATSGGGTSSLAYLSLGTGISAGIVLDGQILRGANGFAGEIGHLSAEPHGERCACGLDGCIETVAAGPAIARLARTGIAAGAHTTLSAATTATDVFRAAAAGDGPATEIAALVAERLVRAIRTLVLTLGVDYIAVGGGVASAGDALLQPLLDAIARERAASAFADAAFASVRVEIVSPELEAGARGAAAIARRRMLAVDREGVAASQ